MANIRKIKGQNGIRWEVRIRRSNHPTISKTFSIKSDAQSWAVNTEQAMERGELNKPQQSITLKELLHRYIVEVSSFKKGSEQEAYKIAKLQQHRISSVNLSALTSTHLSEYREERLKCVSTGTVIKDLGLISNAIEIGRKEWGIPLHVNLVSLIRKPKAPRSRNMISNLRRITKS